MNDPALIAGLALAVLVGVSLGFFGGGGSILTVPLLVYVFGLDPKRAIAGSLLIVGLASLSAAIQHWREGNVRLGAALVFGTAGMGGAYLGGRAGELFDGTLLLLLFAATMLLAATAMWRGRRRVTVTSSDGDATRKLVVQGFGVGSFTGLIGAGGGFLIVPALALWTGMPMRCAIGTSLVVIAMNTLSGFAGYVSHVEVDYALVAAVAAAAIVGSFGGSRLALVVEPSSLRRYFAVFISVMGVVILVRESPVWLDTALTALPSSLPQAFFALVMLAVGIATGRGSRRPGAELEREREFKEGEGI